MSQFWSPIVSQLTPYVAGEQPKEGGLIKLNTNESPFGPSPKAIDAMHAQLDDSLRLYPDPDSELLVQAISEYYGLPIEQIFVGNGSDEVLAFCFQALLKHSLPLLFPDITYNFYSTYCRLFDIDFQTVPLTQDFRIDLNQYPSDNGGIIFANPNAPTGIAVSLNDIESLLQRCTRSVVVVDEAYVDFGADTAIALVKQYPNLLVMQTFSKSRALAGLRVGFAVGDSKLIEALDRVKNSFNAYPLDRVAIAGAAAALNDKEHFEKIRQTVINNRKMVTGSLESFGFNVLPSKANFVFCRHPQFEGTELAKKLRANNILVRHFKQKPIDQWLRVSIGTQEECDAFVQAVNVIVNAL